MATEKSESPPRPSEEALELMRSHLKDKHSAGFELERDVSFEGNARADAMLTFRPETPAAPEGFRCAECPGRVFAVAKRPKLSPERIAHLARHDPELRRRLVDVPSEDQAELVEIYESEKSGAEMLAARRRRSRMRTAKPPPAAQERRDRANSYLLAKYEEIGNVEETLWALAQLRTRDPKAYRKIIGSDEHYKLETLRKYWQQIPLAKRQAAKQRYLDRLE